MTWVITRLCRDCIDQSCVEECINCAVCEPECPWEAIFENDQVPDKRAVPEVEGRPAPAHADVEENKREWGYAA